MSPPLHAGDRLNLQSPHSRSPYPNLPPLPGPLAATIRPALTATHASLIGPQTLELLFPAPVVLPPSLTAAQCNEVARITSISGPVPDAIASCYLASETALHFTLSAPLLPGTSLNLHGRNPHLRLASPTGPPFFPASADLPILPTLASAVLTSYTDLAVPLPLPAALPINYTTYDCTTALDLPFNIATCVLNPDRSSLAVTLPSKTTYTRGDSLDVRRDQVQLRAADMLAGSGFVTRGYRLPVTPTLFSASAHLTGSSTVRISLPFPSAVAPGANCTASFALSPSGTTATTCTISADDPQAVEVSLWAAYTPGDSINLLPRQTELLLDDGSTPYVPAASPILILPTLASASLAAPTTILVTLSFPGTLSSPDSCNAALTLRTSTGDSITSPIVSCSLSPDGLTLILQLAPSYTPATGETVDITPGQTALVVIGDSGLAFAPRYAPAPLLVPSPPPPAPGQPSPLPQSPGAQLPSPMTAAPEPAPAPTAASVTARGLATGYLQCGAMVGSRTALAQAPTVNGNFMWVTTEPAPPVLASSAPRFQHSATLSHHATSPRHALPCACFTCGGHVQTDMALLTVRIPGPRVSLATCRSVSPSASVSHVAFLQPGCVDAITNAPVIEGTAASLVLDGMAALVVSPVTALAAAVLPDATPLTNFAAAVKT